LSQLCNELHQILICLPRFRFPFGKRGIPANGIYIVFEQGESGHGMDRIVRVGTHTGDNRLWSRLREHFVNENKDRSIFRKNVGRAILNKSRDPFLVWWNKDLTTKESREKYQNSINLNKQKEVEKHVTKYMRGRLSFVVFQVDEKRDDWESKIISTVSWCEECAPSRTWLGLHSPQKKIRKSGLWNVNELYKQPLCEDDLEKLKGFFRIDGWRKETYERCE